MSGQRIFRSERGILTGSVILAAMPMFFDRRLPNMGDEALFRLLEVLGRKAERLALTPDAVGLDDLVAAGVPDKLAIVVGTEGEGLSRRWIEQADAVVSIPMAHGVDSLNVAAATAVACWALR